MIYKLKVKPVLIMLLYTKGYKDNHILSKSIKVDDWELITLYMERPFPKMKSMEPSM